MSWKLLPNKSKSSFSCLILKSFFFLGGCKPKSNQAPKGTKSYKGQGLVIFLGIKPFNSVEREREKREGETVGYISD